MDQRMIRTLDLFSGIGGFAYGLERLCGGFETVAFCEIDPYCRKVLAKNWPKTPILGHIQAFGGDGLNAYFGPIDLICGGFPCQPWSAAGNQRGDQDDRHLWPEMLRLIAEIRPRWVLGENVKGLAHSPMGLDQCLSDLEAIGYQAQPFMVPACAADAPHRRDRIWIVANSRGGRQRGAGGGEIQLAGRAQAIGTSKTMADPDRKRLENGKRATCQKVAGTKRYHCNVANASIKHDGRSGAKPPERQESEPGAGSFGEGRFWSPEPELDRVANGIPNRVDRLRALGNSVVPQVVAQFGRAILEAEGA